MERSLSGHERSARNSRTNEVTPARDSSQRLRDGDREGLLEGSSASYPRITSTSLSAYSGVMRVPSLRLDAGWKEMQMAKSPGNKGCPRRRTRPRKLHGRLSQATMEAAEERFFLLVLLVRLHFRDSVLWQILAAFAKTLLSEPLTGKVRQ